jgi:hypothetical protein
MSFSVTLTRGPKGLGFNIKGGKGHNIPIIISKVDPEGPAGQVENFEIGAELLAVNGVSLVDATHADAVALLKKEGDITLELRPNQKWKRKFQLDHPSSFVNVVFQWSWNHRGRRKIKQNLPYAPLMHLNPL